MPLVRVALTTKRFVNFKTLKSQIAYSGILAAIERCWPGASILSEISVLVCLLPWEDSVA